MSRRLTNAIKDKLIENVLTTTFAERDVQLQRLEHTVAAKAYRELISESIETKMDALPSGFFDEAATVKFCTKKDAVPGEVCRSTSHCLRLQCSLYSPAKWRWECNEVLTNEAFLTVLIEYYSAKQKVESDRAVLKAKLNTLLAAVSTDKALLETWPEASLHMPYEMFPAPKQALTLTGSELNAQIQCSMEANCA